MHTSFEDALSDAGVDVTLITKGAFKADGSDMKKLAPGALKRMQADIDAVGLLFDQTVARNRGLKVADVAGFEAATFMGALGVKAGLADAVMAPDEAIYALVDALR